MTEKEKEETFVMICRGFAADIACPFEGQFLETFTPFEETKGTFTSDIDKAMTFATRGEALKTWTTSIGIRPDGELDRPLTAFTVEIGAKEDFR